MSLQYNDEDDYFDDEDDTEDSALEGEPLARPRPSAPHSTGKRRLRTRPMTPSMMEKHPHVVSILLTRSNGQQLIFIRK